MLSVFLWVVGTVSGQTVEFSLEGEYSNVSIAGDLTGWEKPVPLAQKDGRFVYQAELSPKARIEYKFVADGQWILDPKNPKRISNGLGGENSVWEGSEYVRSAWASEPKVPLAHKKFLVKSEIVMGRYVEVFWPENAKGKLPVIIYGDGSEYVKRVHADWIAKNLMDAKKIKPIALVFVYPFDRLKEYWKKPEPYFRFLFDEMMVAVRAVAPISSNASDVFIGGASLGGYCALRVLVERPDAIAGGIHSQSGSFWIEPPLLNNDTLKKIPKNAKLFFDWGEFERELTKSNVDLTTLLRKERRKFGMATTPEGHNWTAWQSRFADGLVFLFGK